MKEGFNFNEASLKFLRIIYFQKFWWWGENRKEPRTTLSSASINKVLHMASTKMGQICFFFKNRGVTASVILLKFISDFRLNPIFLVLRSQLARQSTRLPFIISRT